MEKLNYYKLTNPQQNILEVEQSLLTSNNTCNILVSSVKFNMDLSSVKLEKTLNKVIELNDAFRIRLLKVNHIIKQYIKKYEYEEIEKMHFKSYYELEEFIDIYKEQKLDIYGKLYDFKIANCNNQTYVIYKVHHIINDAWGITQVAEQIKEIYGVIDNEYEIKKLNKPSYLEVIKKDEEYRNSSKYKADNEFWSEYIKELSTEKIFNKDISDNVATRYIGKLNNDICEKISRFCQKNKITEYTFFLATISIYYFKIYNVNSVNIGTPFLNRTKKELSNMGLFVSNLPLNVKLQNGMYFKTICEEIYKSNFRLFRHSKFPYTDIQKVYSGMNASTNIFEIGFSYQINAVKNKLEDDTGETKWYFTNRQNNPITIHLYQVNGNMELYYDYIIALFEKEQIKTMHDIVLHIIEQVISNEDILLENINVITKKEKDKLKVFNNTGKIMFTNTTMTDMFDEVCKKYSKNIALRYNNEELKYREFYNKVCNLANILRENNVKRNTPVALLFDKSFEMIISMFAVIKAGGYYVPILPTENKERIKYILDDCNPICILTTKEYKDKIKDRNIIQIDSKELAQDGITKLDNINSSNDLLYVIYTSGSTGNPKGTKIMHKNVVGLLQSINADKILKCTESDVSMSLLKYSFDASGIDIYSSIYNGGKLILISKEDELNPNRVIEIMEKEKVTRSFLVPKWLEHINNADRDNNANLSNLKILGTGGESFNPKVVENLYNKYPGLNILNLYGPTEATMFATYSIIDKKNIKDNYTTIGKLIPYTRALVINSLGDILPTNTKGELVLLESKNSINNLADGYLNLKDITDSKFVRLNNIDNVRAYKTGDIVKINDKFEIEYMGRTDDIIKINNGYLVSINEVEKRIKQIIGNKYQFQVVDINNNTTKSLILFIETDETVNLELLKKHINSQISFYMRIKDVIKIRKFPQNNSGKIDKKELKGIAEKNVCRKEILLPTSTTEKKLYNIIRKQCEIDNFSIKDDFIDDLGIDSLNMSVIYSLINSNQIKMQDLYTYTTIEELAKLIDNPIDYSKQHLFKNITINNNAKEFDISNVLLTGATGFLGIHILLELLKCDEVKQIYCLVRSKENITSYERLYEKLQSYNILEEIPKEVIDKKIIVLDGDVIKERFGLSKEEYKKIGNIVTTVINSAANVKHYGKYEKMHITNVSSVEKILDFCGGNISFAHISTLSIAGFKNEQTEDKVYDENTLYIKQDFNNNPYLLTKYEAEETILSNKNVNSKIFRLGNIMPRKKDGVFQENYSQNAFLSAVRLMLRLKKVPKSFLDFKVEFSPVDECALSIMRLIRKQSNNKIYHIVNNKEVSIKDLLDKIEVKDIEIVSKKEFITSLNTYDEVGSEYIKEYILQNSLNKYSLDITNEELRHVGFEWSKIDEEYIKNLIKLIEEKRW